MSVEATNLDGMSLNLAGTVYQGPPGEQGPTGPQGPAGATGAQGPQGEIGPQGPKGDTGERGFQGLPGPAGQDGITGTDGVDGEDGASAYEIAVANGFVGNEAAWLASLIGPEGPQGEQGETGAQGPKGDAGTGLNNRQNWVSGSTYSPGDYVFAPGSVAATSMWILNGEEDYVSTTQPNTDLTHWIEFEAPSGADGLSVELQRTATAIQWRQTGGAWANLVPLADITGPQGPKGDPGDPGTPGADGADGPQGPAGEQGPAGVDGQDGAPGADGVDGVDGASAYEIAVANDFTGTEAEWLSSLVGPEGPEGPQGPAGEDGEGSVTLANTTQAQAAESAEIATTPAGVREYLEQFGLTSSYTTAPADLNTIVNGGFFNWGDTTVNAPLAGSYGRGMCIPSGSGYVTQWSIENNTGKTHARYQENGIWTEWVEVGASGEGSGEGLPTGGTAGQVLTKQSATDGDADWEDPSGGSGGGGDSAFTRVMAPSNVIIQSLDPVNIVSVPLTAASAYHVQFRGVFNDNANTAGITICVGGIDKRELSLRVGYRDNTGELIFQKLSEGGLENGVTFAGSEANGPGNLLTIDGFLLTGEATTLTIQVCNADAQWDYRQMIQGASVSVEKMGTVTLT